MTNNKETLLGLNKLLKLNYKGYKQDWEIEFANANRVEEFINVVNNEHLSTLERYAVVSLIISSLDDRLNSSNAKNNDKLWAALVKLIDREPSLYLDLLRRWALTDNTIAIDLFAITPLVRDYLNDRGLK